MQNFGSKYFNRKIKDKVRLAKKVKIITTESAEGRAVACIFSPEHNKGNDRQKKYNTARIYVPCKFDFIKRVFVPQKSDFAFDILSSGITIK